MFSKIIDRLAYAIAETTTPDSIVQRWGFYRVVRAIDKKPNILEALQSAISVLSITAPKSTERCIASKKVLSIARKVETSDPGFARQALEFMPMYPCADETVRKEANACLKKMKSNFSYR